MSRASACPFCARPFPADGPARFCPDDGAPLHAPTTVGADTPRVGERIAERYRLTERLAAGAMGLVCRAFDERLERHVAVKMLDAGLCSDPLAVRRFQREARVVARLRHPHTVRLHDVGRTASGALFLVMELVSGVRLSAVLAAGPLEPRRAIELTDQVAGALAEAHGQGIVHRDIKADNVLLDRAGRPRDFARVVDFGIAGRVGVAHTLTAQGRVMGTPAYSSPEQVDGRPVDGRSDIYSLGVLLFELLVGARPFAGDGGVESHDRHLYDPVPRVRRRRPEISPELEALLCAMMAKAPAGRPPSMAALRTALRALPEARLGSVPPAG